MSEHYDFHYQPTGSGAISGQQVLEQTEDAINELGDYVNDNVGGAMDVAQQALETAQTAETNAQTALDTANSFSSAIQSAQQDASTALSTAQTAQTTASNANNTAIQASQDASSAVTTANNASGQVSTLSGTVTALGQRVTTAEGNIGQNTSDITALTTRVGTAEGNITTLQNDVTIAQGNASSAMATAGQVKQQAFVFRYSSTALTPSSTNSNTLLDNTDNLKVGDKVIDSSGVLFSITAIDTQNSTFTIGTALIDLAQDSDVVHKTGDETVGGSKTFANNKMVVGRSTDVGSAIQFINSDVVGDSASGKSGFEVYGTSVSDANKIGGLTVGEYSNDGGAFATIEVNRTVSGVKSSNLIRNLIRTDGSKELSATIDNDCKLGNAFLRWSKIYGTEYYYGSNNVEFSTKFVTTDTNQTISGAKTFSDNLTIYNSDSSQNTKNLTISSSKIQVGDTSNSDSFGIVFNAGLSYVSRIIAFKDTSGTQNLQFSVRTKDSSNNLIGAMIRLRSYANGFNSFESDGDNLVSLGSSSNKWKNVQTYLVNGVEPSSLSLPSGNVSDVIDISSYIAALDGTSNSYTVPANGWISIAVVGTAIAIVSSSWSDSRLRASSGNVRMLYPVLKNETVSISIAGTTLAYARFIPCQGNV